MALDSRVGIAKAVEVAEDRVVREAIHSLDEGQIVEARVKPVMSILIGLWQIRGGPLPDPLSPLLRPILLLEGVRVAEAINLLQRTANTEEALAFLPAEDSTLLQEGLRQVAESRLRAALALLQPMLKESSQEVKHAADLLTALADDCAGPLGAVYNQRA